MKNSSLEITENLYHLKLSKNDFDLSFINQLLKSLQARELLFNFSAYPDDADMKSHDDGSDRFDRLDEK
jgi:hypothetical protein